MAFRPYVQEVVEDGVAFFQRLNRFKRHVGQPQAQPADKDPLAQLPAGAP